MAYSVVQRTQEIGIRLALGANAGTVRNMILAQSMVLAGIGVSLGIAFAFGLARLLATFLFGVTAHDPVIFVSVPVLLGAVALFAVCGGQRAPQPQLIRSSRSAASSTINDGLRPSKPVIVRIHDQ